MQPIKHILFPVDFSERCIGAIPFVQATARHYGARVTQISVAHPYYSGAFEGVTILDPQQMLMSLKTELDAWQPGAFAGLEVERVAVSGDPAECIVQYAHTHNVDLVMMPSHGYGPFRQLLLGSVTAKVLHDVRCPVWTTAHNGDDPDREHIELREIVCAVDAGMGTVGLLRSAGDIAKQFGAKLRVVHAVPGVEAWPERQMDQEFEQQIRENARHTIQGLQRSADVDAPVCVGAGTVPDVVREEALQHHADLVVIGRGVLQETMGRLRTHSYGIIRHAPCPVLSI